MRFALLLAIYLCSIQCWADSKSRDSPEFHLVTAAAAGNYKLVQKLLDTGVSVNGRYYAETALISAIRARSIQTVLLLLSRGADANLPNAQATPLAHATMYAGVPSIVAALLKNGAEPDMVHPRDREQRTALDFLAWMAKYRLEDQIANARYLVAAGANVDRQNAYGGTPLRSAISWNKVGLARYLLEAGANPNQVMAKEFNGFLEGEVTLFHAIAQYGVHKDARMTRLLLEFGANPNYRNDRLFQADMRGRESMWSGTSPLMLAAEMGYIELVQVLLQHRATPCLRRTDGASASEIALKAGHGQTAALLQARMKRAACPAE